MYLDLGRWITGSAWCSSSPGSIFSAAVSVYISSEGLARETKSTSQGNMGDSEPPGILCESCACIIHTNLQSCMSIIRPFQYNFLLQGNYQQKSRVGRST